MNVVADIGALHPEDHVFGNVGSVIGDALEITRHEQCVESLSHKFRTLVHTFDELNEGIVAHAVNHVIHFEDSLGKFHFAFDEGFEGAPNHRAHGCTHATDIDRKIGSRKLHHVHDTLGNINGLIADTFEVGIDLGNRKDEAKVHSHGLLHGKQVEGGFIDFTLGGIDEGLAFQHHLAASQVALDKGLTRTVHRLLRQTSHAKQTFPQIIEPLLKARTHYVDPSLSDLAYPNRPVM
jgi:hypothetical protein